MADKFIVEGYEFDTVEEAEIAKQELEAVRHMAEKTEGCTPEVAYKFYNKIVEGHLFKTPIGYDYLRELEKFLVVNGMLVATEEPEVPQMLEMQELVEFPEPQEIVAEPVVQELSSEPEKVDVATIEFLKSNIKAKEVSVEELQKKLKKTEGKLQTSIMFNIILAIGVLAMLYIASTSNNVNIINYETALQDKYSAWAQELTEKENQLKEREKALEELEKNQ